MKRGLGVCFQTSFLCSMGQAINKEYEVRKVDKVVL